VLSALGLLAASIDALFIGTSRGGTPQIAVFVISIALFLSGTYLRWHRTTEQGSSVFGQ